MRNEVGAVADELGIDAERTAQRAFDLVVRVVALAQLTRGTGDERFQLGLLGKHGGANVDHAPTVLDRADTIKRVARPTAGWCSLVT